MPELQIKPLEGIGDVNFGMPVGVVRRILGEPEKSVIDIQEDRGNLTANRLIYSRKWAYPSLGIVLSFTAPHELAFDLRLRSITIEGCDATLDGVRLLGLTEKEFLNAIASTRIGAVELISKLQPVEWADPEFEIREYACERVRMTFWVENGIVTSISMWDDCRTTPYIKFKTTVKLTFPGIEEDQ